MGVNYNVLGLVFASMHDSTVSDLTTQRTMGSVLFGGRYRLIDFPLSNMVNSSIVDVGVITKSNYGSLLDHLGSGRQWDLSRKKGGLHLLPPYSQIGGLYRGRIDALDNIWSFLEHSSAKYIVMSDCDFVTTIDFNPVLKQHIAKNADITVIYGKGFYDSDVNRKTNVVEVNGEGKVSKILVEPQFSGECNIGLNMFIITKDFLRKVVKDAVAHNKFSFVRDVLQNETGDFRIYGYEHKDYFLKIDSMQSYFNANMELLVTKNRKALFKEDSPIFTKVGDSAPVKYGIESKIKNSLIADGCVIEGTVENCVLFRGVKVGKNTVLKNCIIMQAAAIGDNCTMSEVIIDKNVTVSDEKVLTGSRTHPLYVKKNAKI